MCQEMKRDVDVDHADHGVTWPRVNTSKMSFVSAVVSVMKISPRSLPLISAISLLMWLKLRSGFFTAERTNGL